MIKEAIGIMVEGRSLSSREAALVMEEIMDGEATPAQLSAFITALRMKGETVDEIAGLVEVMRSRAVQVKVLEPVVDIVGTGGDGQNTFNISTAAGFVAAGAGLRVAKHGNRAISSRCGSADVLEKLGVRIALSAADVQACIREVGIGFMFAPVFHPAMKYAAVPRREIGIRTVFNILGPLSNPANAEYQVIGVPEEGMAAKMASVLTRLPVRHALVIHGIIGLDEISISGGSLYWEIREGEMVTCRREVFPGDFGLPEAPLAEVTGGMPEENAKTILDILSGEKGPGRNIVVLNAAAALVAGDMAGSLREGATLAQAVIDRGYALQKLHDLVEYTGNLAEVGRDSG